MKGIAGLVDAFLGLRSSASNHDKIEPKVQPGNSGRPYLPTELSGQSDF